MESISYLLLHGFTGGRCTFEPFLRHLPRQTKYLAPLLTGHGSAWPTSQAIASFQQQVESIIWQVRNTLAPPIHLLGYSMGARIGLALLQAAPTLVQHAWLIGVHPGLATLQARQQRQAQEQQWITQLKSQPYAIFLANWQQQTLFANEHSLGCHLQQQRQQERKCHSPLGLVHAIRTLGLSAMPNLQPALCQTHVPIDLLAGDNDLAFLTLHRAIAQQQPHIRCHEILGAGHHVLLTHTEQVVQMLRQYDRNLQPTSHNRGASHYACCNL